MSKPNFKFAWEYFRDNYIASMGGMAAVDERFLEDLECAFYTGAIVFIDQQANIVASHQDLNDPECVTKGQVMMEELVQEIAGTYEDRSREEEEQLIAEGLVDQRTLQPKGMVN